MGNYAGVMVLAIMSFGKKNSGEAMRQSHAESSVRNRSAADIQASTFLGYQQDIGSISVSSGAAVPSPIVTSIQRDSRSQLSEISSGVDFSGSWNRFEAIPGIFVNGIHLMGVFIKFIRSGKSILPLTARADCSLVIKKRDDDDYRVLAARALYNDAVPVIETTMGAGMGSSGLPMPSRQAALGFLRESRVGAIATTADVVVFGPGAGGSKTS